MAWLGIMKNRCCFLVCLQSMDTSYNLVYDSNNAMNEWVHDRPRHFVQQLTCIIDLRSKGPVSPKNRSVITWVTDKLRKKKSSLLHYFLTIRVVLSRMSCGSSLQSVISMNEIGDGMTGGFASMFLGSALISIRHTICFYVKFEFVHEKTFMEVECFYPLKFFFRWKYCHEY